MWAVYAFEITLASVTIIHGSKYSDLKELFHELKALVKEQDQTELLKELSARFGF